MVTNTLSLKTDSCNASDVAHCFDKQQQGEINNHFICFRAAIHSPVGSNESISGILLLLVHKTRTLHWL